MPPGGGAGQLDPRNLTSVLRNVLGAHNVMTDTWAALATLSAAGLSEASASWPLLRGLDILSAADVIVTLQVRCSSPPPAPPTASMPVSAAQTRPRLCLERSSEDSSRGGGAAAAA